MPLYEFQCDECGHRFEIIQLKFSDPPPAACPKCGGTVQKLVSSPAFQFKGSGWYVTDYAKKSDGKSSSDASESKDSAAKETKESKETSTKDAAAKDKGSADSTSSSAAPSSTTPTTKSS
jgi:putative FmdB family regulatory protein